MGGSLGDEISTGGLLVNRRQSGRCFISGKSLTLYQKRRLELGTAKLTDYFQLRLKVKGGICYGFAVHHECTILM